MNISHIKMAAMVFLAALAFYPHSALAEKFTGKIFAKRSQESQDAYIQTSVTMAGVVATQVKPEISRCINDWYFKDAYRLNQRNRFLRETISKYPNHHPSGVILAILQKQCGSFK